jgi:hypothetical protein
VERDQVNPRRRRARRVLIVAGTGLAVILAAILWLRSPGDSGAAGGFLLGPEPRAPDSVRVRVEILNATTTPRLALAATRVLRDRGFDVVATGNHPVRRDSTLVLDRTGHPHWARLVAGALHSSAVEARPDSSRYVDVTVLLGADWTPPSKPFDP